MAEITPEEARALCKALEPVMEAELGEAVELVDRSSEGLPWDFEALAVGGRGVLRRIDVTRSISQSVMKGRSELVDDYWRSLQEELQALGVRGIWVSIHTMELQGAGRKARREAAKLLAREIKQYVDAGLPLEEFQETFFRRRVVGDPSRLLDAFGIVFLRKGSDGAPAIVASGGDRRGSFFVAPVSDAISEIVKKKLSNHGEAASDLTLVVQLHNGMPSQQEIDEARGQFHQALGGFRSLYVYYPTLERGIHFWRLS